MKFRLVIVLPFMVSFAFLSTVWSTLAQEHEGIPVSQVPVLPTSILYKQVGGVARAVVQQNGYVYVGMGAHLDVYDVQDPTNPILIAQTGQLTNSIISLDLMGSYAVAAVKYGLYIFDISNPLFPQLVCEYPLPSYIIANVEISGTLAFVAENRNIGLYTGGGLRVLDLSNPLQPTQLSLFGEGDGVRALSLYSHYAYLGYQEYSTPNSYTPKTVILDVSDPTMLVEVDRINNDILIIDGAVYDHYLYWKGYNTGMGIYDLTDPAAPLAMGLIPIPDSAYKIEVFDDKLYALDGWSSRVYDLSDPIHPSSYGTYNPNFYSSLAVDVDGDIAYIAYELGGLRIIDTSQATLPEMGVSNRFSSPVAVAAVDDYVYILNQEHELYVTDVTDPANPIEVGQYRHLFRTGMLLLNNDLFLSGDGGFEIVDVTDPLSPTQRSTYTSVGYWVHDMQIRGDYAFLDMGYYVADSLEIVDVADRDQPAFVASIGTFCHSGQGLQVVGNYVFLSEDSACSGSYGQLTVVDIISPTQPQIVAVQSVSHEVKSLAYLNGYVYMGGDMVYMIDVTNPLSPTFTGYYTITNVINAEYEVTAVDGYLYVTEYNGWGHPTAKVIFDVSDPAAPVAVGPYLYTNGLPLALGEALYTYVPAADDGLLIYLDSLTPPQANAGAAITAVEGGEITFSGSMTGTGVLMNGIYWDFGDGNTAVGSLTPIHAYGDDGVFTVTLTVTNIGGMSDTDSIQVTIENAEPVVIAGMNMTTTVNHPVAFAGVLTDPGYLDTHNITWDFADAHIMTGTLTPTHTYLVSGVYIVTLTITDDDGGVGSDTLQVTVQDDRVMVYLPIVKRIP